MKLKEAMLAIILQGCEQRDRPITDLLECTRIPQSQLSVCFEPNGRNIRVGELNKNNTPYFPKGLVFGEDIDNDGLYERITYTGKKEDSTLRNYDSINRLQELKKYYKK